MASYEGYKTQNLKIEVKPTTGDIILDTKNKIFTHFSALKCKIIQI
jgi:hypothetical protein